MNILGSFIVTLSIGAALTACGENRNFSERKSTVYNHDAGIHLGATLTMPLDTATPRAAILLVSGSGQQNRDEEIMGHRPFKVIAETLSSQGYAVLRVDDRGVGGDGTGDFSKAVNNDFVTDALAGIALLDSLYPGKPIGVLGHSEGGSVAVKCATRTPRCNFIITLAGPVWRGDSIIMSQCRAMAVAINGKWEQEGLQSRLLDVAASSMPVMMARIKITSMLNEQVGALARLPEVQKNIQSQIDAVLSPWYRDMLSYDPAEDIRCVKVPWLALNGDKDMQVLVESLSTIKELNPGADTVVMKGHNHLFQECVTGLPAEYGIIMQDISTETISTITDWLNSRF